MARKSALSREPSKPRTGGGLTQSLQRLSPGVYRDAGGRLTNQGGRPLPQQPNRMAPPQARPPMVNLPGQMLPGTNVAELISGVVGSGNRPGSYRPGFGPSDFGNAVAWQPQGNPYSQYNSSYQKNPSWERPPMPPQQMQQPQFLQNQALQGAAMGAGAALGGEEMSWPGGSRDFYQNQMQQQYGQPQNMDPNGLAIGPGGQQMTVQQLQQMKAQNPNRFGSIS